MKDNRRSAELLHPSHLAAVNIESDQIARPIRHERSRNKFPRAHHGLRVLEDGLPRRVIEQVDVAGVHVYRRDQTGVRGPAHVRPERGPIHVAVGGEREQDRRNTGDLSSWADHGDRINLVRHGGLWIE